MAERMQVQCVHNQQGRRTERDILMDEFFEMLQGGVGGVSRKTLDETVKLDGEENFTSVGTIPKNARIISSALNVTEPGATAGNLQLGTKDDPAHLGTADEPEEEGGPQQLSQWHDDPKPHDEDLEIGVTAAEPTDATVRVVVVYEVLNGWDE